MSQKRKKNRLGFFKEILARGRVVRETGGRAVIIDPVSGSVFQYARLVWNTNNPHDMVNEGEDIHHINCDPGDDRPENLQKLSRPEHERIHWEYRNWPSTSLFNKPKIRRAS
jgi:hypothetical protein